MAARVKAWEIIMPAPAGAMHADGRHAGQVRARISATSREAAAHACSTSEHDFSQYGSPQDLVDDDLELVGLVRYRPLDPGDTIDGTIGWRVADPQPTRYVKQPRDTKAARALRYEAHQEHLRVSRLRTAELQELWDMVCTELDIDPSRYNQPRTSGVTASVDHEILCNLLRERIERNR